MRVFDISYWQDDNIVDKLVQIGADGVILRLGYTSYGAPVEDEKYAHFLERARAYNLPCGLYHYSKMNNYDIAMAEAQFINDKVYEYYGGNDEPELGVWLDMEDNLTKISNIHDITMHAYDTLKSWSFKTVGVYASYSYFYDYLDVDDLERKQVPIWVAQYSRVNNLLEERPGMNHHGWQFTETYDSRTLDGNEWYKF